MNELPHYSDRRYESCRQRRRYQTDPAFRLDRVNRVRERRGLPLAQSLNDIGQRGQRVER